MGSAGRVGAQTYNVGTGVSPAITSMSQLQSLNPLTIPVIGGVVNMPNTASFTVTGDFTIDVPCIFTNNNWKMNAGAGLKITANSTFNYCIFRANTNSLWRGISATGPTPSPILSTFDLNFLNCTFSNAYHAVDVLGGVRMVFYSNTFLNNHVSIYHNSARQESVYFGKFENNTFDCTATLLPTFAGMAQVYRGSWADVAVELHNAICSYNGGTSGGARNFIYHHNTAVWVDRSTVNFHNVFEYRYSEPRFTPTALRDGVAFCAENNSVLNLTGNYPVEYFWNNKVSIRADNSNLTTIDKQTVTSEDGIQINRATNHRILIRRHNIVSTHTCIDVSNSDNVGSFTAEGNELISLSSSSFAAENTACIRVLGNSLPFGGVFNDNGVSPIAGYGIFINAADNVTLLNNRIMDRLNINNDPTLHSTGTLIAAVAIQGSRGAKLQGNRISIFGPNNATLFASVEPINTMVSVIQNSVTEQVGPVGIMLTNTPNVQLCSNTIRNMYTSILMRDVCASSSSLTNNTFNEAHYALYFTGSLAMDFQDHRGNVWTGNYTGGKAARHRGTTLIPINGQNRLQGSFDMNSLTATPAGGGTFLPTTIQVEPTIATNQWIKQVTGTNLTSCSIVTPLPTTLSDEILYDENIAKDADLTADYTEEIKKWSKRDLYVKLKENPYLIQNSVVLEAFRDSLDETEINDWYGLLKGIDAATKGSPAAQSSLEAAYTDLESAQTAYANLESNLRATATNGVLDSLAQAQLNAAAAAIVPLSQSYLQAQETAALTRNIALQSLQADNLALLGNEAHLSNQKQVNEIYLSAEYNTDSTFLNSTQIQTLKNIAQTCPIIGGPAVFQARSMISVYGNYTYNDAATCAAAGVSFKTQPKNTVSEKVTLSPNPCSAFVKINLPETNQEAVYRLFDILGKEYTVNFIASTVNSKIIDTHNLENGTYLIKIQGDKNEETLKLVILK